MTAALAVAPAQVRRPRLLLPPVPRPSYRPDRSDAEVLHAHLQSVLQPPAERAWPIMTGTGPDRALLPDPTPLAGSIVLAAVEVLVGMRPMVQLTRWLSPAVHDALAARQPAPAPRRRRPTVRSVHVTRVSASAAEVCVIVHDGERVRAAAARMEAHRRQWRVTALQIG